MVSLYDRLGTAFDCADCGHRHAITLKEVHYGEDAVARLPALCRRHAAGRQVTLVADTRTHAIAGRAAADRLAADGLQVRTVVVADPAPGHAPVCDDLTRAWLEVELRPTDLLVAVGSGVINDLVKWIAGDRHIPYVALATAASMNGYASSNIAPTLRGVKSLLDGIGPVAVLATPDILAAAPYEMTAAGLGDVLAKPVSASDWRLNRLLFDEYYCPFCVGTIAAIEPVYLANPEGVQRREPAAIRALFDALVWTGISMSMAGTSAPASGGEHLISHTLDMMSMLDGTPHDLHGRQVGIGTILGAALYEDVLALDRPSFVATSAPTDSAFWGRFTGAVEAEHAKKRIRAARAATALRETPALWDQIRATLQPELRSPQQIKDCLRRAGAAHRLTDIGVSRERFLAALRHAHEIRERYTILDLAHATGVLPDRAGELVDRWVIA